MHRELVKIQKNEEYPQKLRLARAHCELFQLIINSLPLSLKAGGEHESFVPTLPDLNQQNILVDDKARVSGLLDFDGVLTVHPAAGWAAMPLFLLEDYTHIGYRGRDGYMSHADALRKYRRDYIKHMIDACGGEGDCVYTGKSHLFLALDRALKNEYHEAGHILAKLVQHVIPKPGSVQDYIVRLGDRIEDHELGESERNWLKERFVQLFEPVMGVDARFGL